MDNILKELRKIKSIDSEHTPKVLFKLFTNTLELFENQNKNNYKNVKNTKNIQDSDIRPVLELIIEQCKQTKENDHSLTSVIQPLSSSSSSSSLPFLVVYSSHSFRNILGRLCVASVCYKYPHGSNLFELTTYLINQLETTLKYKENTKIELRLILITCIGHLFNTCGSQISSLVSLSISTLIKSLKNSSNNADLRASIFESLGYIFAHSGGLLDENTIHDCLKFMKNHSITDKSNLVKTNSLSALDIFISSNFNNTHASLLNSSSNTSPISKNLVSQNLDSDYVKTNLLKAINATSSKKVLYHISSSLATCLILDPPNTISSTQDQAALLQSSLDYISTLYIKNSSSSQTQACLMLTFNQIIIRLSPSFIEKSFLIIVDSLSKILSDSHITSNYTKSLIARRHVSQILNDTITKQVLSEIAMVNCLDSIFSKAFPKYSQSNNKKAFLPHKLTLVELANTASLLIGSLGSLVISLQDLIEKVSLDLLAHQSRSLRFAVSSMIKVYATVFPGRIIPLLQSLTKLFNKSLHKLKSGNYAQHEEQQLAGKICLGYATGIMVLISVVSKFPECGSVTLYSHLFSLATSLLKSSSESSSATIAVFQLEASWTILSGLMSLGPTFTKAYLFQIISLWKSSCPAPMSRDQYSEKSIYELNYFMFARENALTSIYSFLQFNSRFVTSDVAKNLSSIISTSAAFLNSLPIYSADRNPFPSATSSSSSRVSNLNPSQMKRQIEEAASIFLPNSNLNYFDYGLLLSRRILQCYSKLAVLNHNEIIIHPSILTSTIGIFADPDRFAPGSYSINSSSNGSLELYGSSFSASISFLAGNYETVWKCNDNYAYGITSLVNGYDKINFIDTKTEKINPQKVSPHKWSKGTSVPALILDEILCPIIMTQEHDLVSLLIDSSDKRSSTTDHVFDNLTNSIHKNSIKNQRFLVPYSTSAIDSAIELFALLIPTQTSKIQESIFEQLLSFLVESENKKIGGRKDAIAINIATAIQGTLEYVFLNNSHFIKNKKTKVLNNKVLKIIFNILKKLICSPDPIVRTITTDAIGINASLSDDEFISSAVKYFIDNIVENRDPDSRSGSALVLSSIHNRISSTSANLHFKTILSVIMSLCNDPHPIVHFWAIEAFARIIDTSAISFTPFVSASLNLLIKFFFSATHSSYCQSVIASNLEFDFSSSLPINRCISSLISAIGPDLMNSDKYRSDIISLLRHLNRDCKHSEIFTTQIIKSFQKLSLFVSSHLDLEEICSFLFENILCLLNEFFDRAREAAIGFLYQLVQMDVDKILHVFGIPNSTTSQISVSTLDVSDAIWLSFDKSFNSEGLKNIIISWVYQKSETDSLYCIDLCQHVLKLSHPSQKDQLNIIKYLRQRKNPFLFNSKPKVAQKIDFEDEEAQSFAQAEEKDENENTNDSKNKESRMKESETGSSESLKLRWQTHLFALCCLRKVLIDSNKSSYTDVLNDENSSYFKLIPRVGEIIRTAFHASTSKIIDIRLVGVKLLDDVLHLFGDAPDPDFQEIPLLEQYQAQIASALTPAFSEDSFPSLVSEALNVCADFVASGIVQDPAKMSRILKILNRSLDNINEIHIADELFDKDQALLIGDFTPPSSSTKIMIQLAILSSWANIEISSRKKPYLVTVVQPNIKKLAFLWLSSLKVFSRLRFEPDAQSALYTTSPESIYILMNREALCNFYQPRWYNIVDAISALIEQDNELLQVVLKESLIGVSAQKYQDDVSSFFLIIYGLCFEALTKIIDSADGLQVLMQSNEIQITKEELPKILNSVIRILAQKISGKIIFSQAIFMETITILNKIALLDSSIDVSVLVIEICRILCINRMQEPSNDMHQEVDQMFGLIRIVILSLSRAYPILQERSISTKLSEENAALLTSNGLNALVSMISVFPTIIKIDLFASWLHIFLQIVQAEFGKDNVVPTLIPILKIFLKEMLLVFALEDDDQIEIHREIINKELRSFFCSIVHMCELPDAQKRRNAAIIIGLLLSNSQKILNSQDPLISKSILVLVTMFVQEPNKQFLVTIFQSLLMGSMKNPLGFTIANALIPSIIELIDDNGKTNYDVISGLVSRILISFVKSLKDSEKIELSFGFVVPTLLHRIKRSKTDSYELVEIDATNELLDLANFKPEIFKLTVSQLSPQQREFLGYLLKKQAKREKNLEDNNNDLHAPKIALRTTFTI